MLKKSESNDNILWETEYCEKNKKIFNNDEKKVEKENNLEKVLKKVDLYLESFENELITKEKVQYILDKTKNKFKIIDKKLIKEQIWGKDRKIAISNYEDFEEKINKTFVPLLKLKFNMIDQNLIVLNKMNIYDFLHSEGLSLNFWNEEEIESKRESLKKNNTENDAKRKLYSYCEELVKHNKIEEYNEYLEKMECMKMKKELENIRDVNREFEKEITEIEIKNFVDKFKDVVEEQTAKEILLKYFKIEANENKRIMKIKYHQRESKHKKKVIFLIIVIFIFLGIFPIIVIFFIRELVFYTFWYYRNKIN